jgi:hypothetical protein
MAPARLEPHLSRIASGFGGLATRKGMKEWQKLLVLTLEQPIHA